MLLKGIILLSVLASSVRAMTAAECSDKNGIMILGYANLTDNDGLYCIPTFGAVVVPPPTCIPHGGNCNLPPLAGELPCCPGVTCNGDSCM